MMRILWVEDDENVAKKRQDFFGGFLESHGFKHISDFSEADSEISGQLYRYDLIVLDINLDKSEDERVIELANEFELSNQEFLEEAGFHLYLKLLQQGFPQNQVIFLTSNVNIEIRVEKIQRFKKAINESTDADEQRQAVDELAPLLADKRDEFEQMLMRSEGKTQIFQWLDKWGKQPTENFDGEIVKNTYEIFEQRFKEARLIPPGAIDKKQVQDCSKKLKNWLGSHCERNIDKDKGLSYDYLTLRRGILNVVTEIKEDSAIELNPTFQELDKITFLEGLICHLRDFSLPQTEYCQPYSTLCEYLTKPFQEAYDGKDLRQDENRHLKLPLYNLRNWIVHGLLVGSNTMLSAQEVGTTFLLAMKGIFNVEKYGHCEELKRLFNTSSVTEQQIMNQIRGLLRRGYANRWKKPLDVIHRKTNKGLNQNWQQENYIRHFYATYLFSIQHLDNYELKDTPFNSIVFHQLQGHL
jgi:CheY-like chemotaxis protein